MGWVHQNKLRLWARISLVILLLSTVKQFIGILEIQYQLASPFIPESGILSIVKPFLIVGLITTLVSIASLLLYFLEKYRWVIILTVLALVGTYFYPYFL